MSNKLTKEQMLSELMVKLETIDGKLDRLLTNNPEIVNSILLSPTGETFLRFMEEHSKGMRLMTNQEFDESFK